MARPSLPVIRRRSDVQVSEVAARRTDGASPEPGAQERAPIAWLEDVTVDFGEERAVDSLSFAVEEGTIFGFIGPSGSGKTTTVRLLTGVQSPTEGTVRVMGADPTRFGRTERAQIGYMPQLSVLYPHLSLWENLNFAASMYGMSLRRRARLREVLDLVDLTGHERKRFRDASGGMQRRLTLAATLVHSPSLLFLDEPTAGIDPVLRRRLWDHFEALRDEGRTLFVTTQYVGEAAYCDRIGLLAEGRLVAVDTPDGLRRRAFGGDVIELTASRRVDQRTADGLCRETWVRSCEIMPSGDRIQVVVDDAQTAIIAAQDWFEQRGGHVESVQEVQRPFDDVFVELVERETAEQAAAPSGAP